MKIVDRELWISMFGLFPAVLLGVFWDDYRSGGMTRAQFLPAALFFVFAIVIMILFSLGKTTFSEDGIEKQYLWFRKRYSWDQVIQAGLIPLDTDHTVKQLAFTFTGGTPWNGKITRNMWMATNGKKCLCAKYRRELQTLVEQCYGPLDF